MASLEEKLVEEGLVSPEAYNQLRAESLRANRSIWVILVRQGILSEEDIAHFFSRQSGIPYIDLSNYRIDERVLALLEENFCIQNCVIPVFRVAEVLSVACSNPFNSGLIDSMARMSGLMVEPLICGSHSILAALDQYWHLSDKSFEAGRYLFRQNPVGGIGMWRQIERLPLRLPVSLKPLDPGVVVRSSACSLGASHDISKDGTAVGVHAGIFLPKGLLLNLEFKVNQEIVGFPKSLRAAGEIVHCRMERAGKYFLGIRFTDISADVQSRLLHLSSPDASS